MSSSDLGWCSWRSARSKQCICSCYALLAPARMLQALPAPGELKCLCLRQCLRPGPVDRQSCGVWVSSSARSSSFQNDNSFFFPTL